MHIIKGQITKLPTQNEPGFILAINHEQTNLPFLFSCAPGGFLYKGSFVRVKGQLNKEGVLQVVSWEDAGNDFNRADIESLLVRGLALSKEEIDCFLSKTESVHLVEIIKKMQNGSYTLVEEAVEEIFGNDRKEAILRKLKALGKDESINAIRRLMEEKKLNLDYPAYCLINDFFAQRAAQQDTTVASLLDKDLYLLAHVPGLPGSRFDILKDLDRISEREGKQLLNEKRIKGIASACLWHVIEKGHIYAEAKSFRAQVASRVLAGNRDEKTTKSFFTILNSVLSSPDSGFVQDNSYDKKAVYFVRTFFSEKMAAESLVAILKSRFAEKLEAEELINCAAAEALAVEGIEFNEAQKDFIGHVGKHKVTLLLGEAGTGKSTVLAALCRAYKKITGKEAVILGTTGCAAQAAAAKAGVDLYATIHRYASIESYLKDYSLHLPEGTEENQFSGKDTGEGKLIVVDEMSMCDIVMLARLLHTGSPESRYVFVGDPDQIPPVGPGAVFKTLIKLCTQDLPGLSLCTLENPYRQEEQSPILALARAVRENQWEKVMKMLKGEYPEIQVADLPPEEVLAKTCELYQTLPHKDYRKLLVVTFNRLAKNRKNIGIDTVRLNFALKKISSAGRSLLNTGFAIGEPVINIRNDYAPGDEVAGTTYSKGKQPIYSRRADRSTIFNGTKGIIQGISVNRNGEQLIEISYTTPLGEIQALYYPEEIGIYLESGYALTVHKAQGQGVEHLILVAAESGGFGRDLFYTAITRASKQLTLIGPLELWEEMIKREPEGYNEKFTERVLAGLGRMETKTTAKQKANTFSLTPMADDW